MRCERAHPPRLPAAAETREAAVLERDQDVARAHLGDRVERHQEVVVVLELLPDELLGLALVRRDEERAGLDRETQRLALRVEDDPDVPAGEVAHGVRVERRRDLARKRSGEDDEVRAAREVVELLDEHLELAARRPRVPHSLISVCVPAVGSTTAVDVRDSAAIRTKSLRIASAVSSSMIRVPVRPAREPGRDDRHLEDLQRTRDVDPLAAREREHLARAVAEADLEHGHRERPVERGVRRHRDDHVTISQAFRTVCVAYHRAFAKKPASATDAAVTRFDDATSRLPSYTSTRPTICAFRTGSASASARRRARRAASRCGWCSRSSCCATRSTSGRPYPTRL